MTISITACGFFSWSEREMPLSCSSCCHSFGRPVNSPVDELKPTWVRCTGSYGVEISSRLDEFRKLGMKLKPFLPLMVPVVLRLRPLPALIVPEEESENADGFGDANVEGGVCEPDWAISDGSV